MADRRNNGAGAASCEAEAAANQEPRPREARTAMSVKSRLASIPLFDQFSEDELERLIEISRAESFDANCTVFSEGDPPDKLYLILAGKVAISKEQEDRGKVALGTLGK